MIHDCYLIGVFYHTEDAIHFIRQVDILLYSQLLHKYENIAIIKLEHLRGEIRFYLQGGYYETQRTKEMGLVVIAYSGSHWCRWPDGCVPCSTTTRFLRPVGWFYPVSACKLAQRFINPVKPGSLRRVLLSIFSTISAHSSFGFNDRLV